MNKYVKLVEETNQELEEKKFSWKCKSCGSKTPSNRGEQRGRCDKCGNDTNLKVSEETLEEAKARGEVQKAVMDVVDKMKTGETLDLSSNKELLDRYGISKLMNAGADLGKKGLVDWDGSNVITVKEDTIKESFETPTLKSIEGNLKSKLPREWQNFQYSQGWEDRKAKILLVIRWGSVKGDFDRADTISVIEDSKGKLTVSVYNAIGQSVDWKVSNENNAVKKVSEIVKDFKRIYDSIGITK